MIGPMDGVERSRNVSDQRPDQRSDQRPDVGPGLRSDLRPGLRSDLRPGLRVAVVLKEDQRSGRLTEGIVKDILTRSASHPHGIKVRLASGLVGRVKRILPG